MSKGENKKNWSKETFGDIWKDKKEVEATIKELDETDTEVGLNEEKRREVDC